MNHLHRELAPITEAAWEEIEDEARRTYQRWIAGRRVVDVDGPKGFDLSAVGTGHVHRIDGIEGAQFQQREAQLIVELRVPFTVTRAAVDDVERGADDADWDPVKESIKKVALAEDKLIFEGAPQAGIRGIIPDSSNDPVGLPEDIRQFPDAVAKALTTLRLAGVNGPYALLLSADLFTQVSETTDQGVPVIKHVERLVDQVIWAPAITGGLLLSTRGGDYELTLGEDLSIGYLSHDADTIQLFHEETLTFRPLTAEASVAIR